MSLEGRVGLVTGCSSGIGRSIATAMVQEGMKVVGCGRNVAAMEEVARELSSKYKGEMKVTKCDLENESEIYDLFRFVDDTYGALHVVVNNAAFSTEQPILTGEPDIWRRMLEVNVLAVAICSKEAVKLMRKHDIDDGFVFNINSLSGHKVAHHNPTHFYAATKFAVTALTEAVRQELRLVKSNIRISNICPGLVETDFHFRMFPSDAERAGNYYKQFKVLEGKDIADVIVYAMKAPSHVELCDLIIRPTNQSV